MRAEAYIFVIAYGCVFIYIISISISIYLPIYLSTYLSIYLSIYLYPYKYIYIYIYISEFTKKCHSQTIYIGLSIPSKNYLSYKKHCKILGWLMKLITIIVPWMDKGFLKSSKRKQVLYDRFLKIRNGKFSCELSEFWK